MIDMGPAEHHKYFFCGGLGSGGLSEIFFWSYSWVRWTVRNIFAMVDMGPAECQKYFFVVALGPADCHKYFFCGGLGSGGLS
jgi:hypothetical protein